ncbi:BgTH12-06687 [Blumeria graminis f. sp. triticale]|uniref:BgtE-5638 n=3 Tax=Blumeria graminis TaxID=34373 RepID=A0A061HDL8_BLUGR|nr:putative secreted effector protein [Blumeria graminis f. sp. tritici 96224]CAD6500986.1 BgTH12-06687 [Blumeria graminis f. sp. triticale]VCU41298.1 BgtE-5638 [Blumeria graminis f. sp. tritici]
MFLPSSQLLLTFTSLFISIVTALTPQRASFAEPMQPLEHQTFLESQLKMGNDTTESSNPSIPLKAMHARNPFIQRRVAAGGGAIPISPAPSQYPTVTNAGSLFTVGTSTSAIWKEFTQTFAVTPLGTWTLGPTPKSGSIGLGTIVGNVGSVKSEKKRSMPTPPPILR